MATVLTQVLPAADAKIRFMEPFVSAGLNMKGTGIIPPGVYRGFIPSVVGLNLTLAAEPPPPTGPGDSVAVASTLDASNVPNFFNVTVRHVGDVSLDFTGVLDGTYFVVLEVKYDVISATPLNGITEVRIKVISPGDLIPQAHVILTRVVKAGVLLTIDNSVRMATGGPLVTPNDVSGAMRVLGTSFYNGPILSAGGVQNLPMPPINFSISTTKTVLVAGTALSLRAQEDLVTRFFYSLNGVDQAGVACTFGQSGSAVDDIVYPGTFIRFHVLSPGTYTVQGRADLPFVLSQIFPPISLMVLG